MDGIATRWLARSSELLCAATSRRRLSAHRVYLLRRVATAH